MYTSMKMLQHDIYLFPYSVFLLIKNDELQILFKRYVHWKRKFMNKVGSTTDINSEASYQGPSFMGQCSAITIDSRVHNEGRERNWQTQIRRVGGTIMVSTFTGFLGVVCLYSLFMTLVSVGE